EADPDAVEVFDEMCVRSAQRHQIVAISDGLELGKRIWGREIGREQLVAEDAALCRDTIEAAAAQAHHRSIDVRHDDVATQFVERRYRLVKRHEFSRYFGRKRRPKLVRQDMGESEHRQLHTPDGLKSSLTMPILPCLRHRE